MLKQLFFIISVSLFDSLSTTQQIMIFALLLTTAKPVRNSMAFLAGLSAAYFACGACGYFVIDKLAALYNRYFSAQNIPDGAYYRAELLCGIIFTAIGVYYFFKKRNPEKKGLEAAIISKLYNMNPFLAAAAGVLMSVTSFPVSAPYIAAIGKFAVSGMKVPEVIACIAVYNLGYAAPMLAIFVFYLAMRRGVEGIEEKLHIRAESLNRKLNSAVFTGMGLFCVLDSAAYFAAGHALLKNKFF